MRISSRDSQGYDRASNRSNRKSQFAALNAPICCGGAAMRPRSDADVVHVALEKSDHADEDQVKRHDVVEQPRHEKDQDAGDQRHQRRDGDTQGHAYFLPLEASCMSRPACSTASPALPMAFSTWRPARAHGPALSSPSRL